MKLLNFVAVIQSRKDNPLNTGLAPTGGVPVHGSSWLRGSARTGAAIKRPKSSIAINRFGKIMVKCILLTGRSGVNVKEHAPLLARASVDHGVGVETKVKHENRAADRDCSVSTFSH